MGEEESSSFPPEVEPGIFVSGKKWEAVAHVGKTGAEKLEGSYGMPH